MAIEGRFASFDGGQFYERRWPAAGEVRAHVLIIHGYGEHCGRYDPAAEFLNAAGFNVFSYDQRWHGRSPGTMGYVKNFDLFLRDLDAWRAHRAPELTDKPLLMLAHSMGGLVATRYLETRDFHPHGVIFSSPFLALEDVSPALLAASGLLSALVPWLPVATLDATTVSRDPAVVEAYLNDPLVNHKKINARTGEQFSTSVRTARQEAHKIAVPAYIMHGTADRLVPYSGSEFLHGAISSEDKTLKIYEQGFHELMNDTIREEVLAGLRDWLLAHSGGH